MREKAEKSSISTSFSLFLGFVPLISSSCPLNSSSVPLDSSNEPFNGPKNPKGTNL